ncbi:MAG: hypothetical protein A2Y33_11710 [Spirochaetes bacterium GWF1_51_8]|nr:MAG: hypothetical protein A2Y33_11710 [Spirochaetes bacterium GWF1_51_8]
MKSRGIVLSERIARNAFYSFTRKGGTIKRNVAYGFKTPDWSGWDWKWRGAAFSAPDPKLRHKIRSKLIAYRFAPLYPGFWIRPLHSSEPVEEQFSLFIESGHTVLMEISRIPEVSVPNLIRIWNLDKISEIFAEGIAVLEKKLDESSGYPPEKAFIEKMNVGGYIIGILSKDPLLPEMLLPVNWAGKRLRDLFTQWESVINVLSEPLIEKIFQRGED